MPLELAVVDAFTARPFAGNPAAVAVVDAYPDDDFMQSVASEMNLSETAFVVPRAAAGEFDLRWFAPTVEVDLCGHATLASAHVLGGSAVFHTRSGVLTCRAGAPGWDGTPGEGAGFIDMDFPADPPVAAGDDVADALAGPSPLWVGRGRDDVVVELSSASAVRALAPDLGAVAALGSRGLLVTAPGDRPGIDCVSRFFGPNAGIPEDPVTGSAHCTLAVLWGARLGRDRLVGEQASARGGLVRMRPVGDRVVLGGQAVRVSSVTIHV
jgi:predicted PhzF superfamily epimerase YddE/YHI9